MRNCAPTLRIAAPLLLLLELTLGCRSSLRFDTDAGIGPLASGLEPGAMSSAPSASGSSFAPPTACASAPTAPAASGAADAGEAANEPNSSEDWPFDVAQPWPASGTADGGSFDVPANPVQEGQLRIDGELLDWSEQSWFRLDDFVAQPGPARAAQGDLQAVFALRWSAVRLYVAVAVRDDEHVNARNGFSIFEGDSVQMAFATSGSEPYDWEYGLALTDSGQVAHSWVPNEEDLSRNLPFAIGQRGNVVSYEWAFVAPRLGQQSFTRDTSLRFGLIVNEADGSEGRSGFLQLVPGIGQSPKSAADFVRVQWQ